jgi:dipeptidyl aminopeptidase/acylaminoacyl peptidase
MAIRTPVTPVGASLLATLLLVFAGPDLEAQDRRPLDHDVYEIWRTIGTQAISPDGVWVLYTLELENGDGELVVARVGSEVEHRIPRGQGPSFDAGGHHVVFAIGPHLEATRAARESGNRNQAPRDSLGILNLATGEVTRIPDVRSFRLTEEGEGWLAYHLHPERREGDSQEGGTEAGREQPPEGDSVARASRPDANDGALVLRNLSSGAETRFPHTASYTLARNGRLLAFTVAPPEGEGAPGVRATVPGSGSVTTLLEGAGSYSQLAVDREGGQAAFLFAEKAADDSVSASDGDAPVEHIVHHWQVGEAAARPVVDAATRGVPDGWWVGEHGSLSFSRNGERLFFGTAPRPAPPPAERTPLFHDEVEVDVWHWQDGDLMSVQRVREDQERRRTYEAVLHLAEGRVVQLADEAVPSVNVHRDGDGELAVAGTTVPYAIMASWESPNPRDLYLIDVRTGERELVAEMSRGFPSLSPGGRYMSWWENADSTWYVRDVETGYIADVSSAIPHPLFNEEHDSPSPAGSWGSPGWLEGDRALLLYDRYDVWAVDPSGNDAPRSLTRGEGRAAEIRYRLIRLDRDGSGWGQAEDPWPTTEPVLLSAFQTRTKDAGFSRTRLDAERSPERLVMEPRLFSTPVQARDADRILFTQQTFRDFPDLWVAGADLRGRTRVSEANPQQSDYRWGTAELMEWTSADGIPLQGIVIKPDDFDPGREYPLMVYFYDRSSDGLHRHYAPVPHRSIINHSMYASHDYVVFIPDIVYRIGYPGESAVNAINPGVFKLLDQGFIDRERIGLQGHSWGGYQIAFMVTRSRELYRAAAPGAPVANMTSAYGGIRRETGLVRQFQYERTQSRLGGNLWDMPLRYIENSPLFWVDKIETPLLIMHNDRDGHVPWEQGIELFTALRRLGKPAWMINYNDEPHWPTSFANRRDWNIRMKQFFDHFLKDAPPPVWMVHGIPAVQKGETLGLELVDGWGPVDRRR